MEYHGDKIIYQAYKASLKGYQFYLLDVASKAKKKLTGAISNSAVPPVIWSPDGKQVAYLSTQEPVNLQVIHIENESIVKYTPFGLTASSHYQWASDSTIIYSDPERAALYLFNILTGSAHVLMSKPDLEIRQFAMDQSDQKVALVARRITHEFFAAYLFDPQTNTLKDIYTPAAMVEKIAWLTSSTLLIQVNDQGRQKIHRYDQGELRDYGMGEVSMDLQLNQEVLLARVYRADGYSSTALLTADTVLEYPPNAGLKKSYIIRDLVLEPDSIPAFLYVPLQMASAPKAIIHLHGGPHLQSRPYWRFDRHQVSALGHYFLSVNYRGSSGYSRSFAEAGSLPNQVADLRSAINYAVDILTIDEKDIFIYTESYAAQIAHQYLTVQNPAEVGGFFMLYPTLDARQLVQLSKQKQINAYLFYGPEDPYLRVDLDQLSLLADETKHLKVFVLTNEGHYFHRSGSWVEVMTQMTQALK